MLGHASAAMTLDQNGHLFGDRLDDVADRRATGRAAAVARMFPANPAMAQKDKLGVPTAQQIRALQIVPPAGFEPAPPPPEGGALSPELRGRQTRKA
jgi:hypothetical protein